MIIEYDLGFERIREPRALLPEGTIIETHTHNAHHNTDLTMGVWGVHRFQPIVGKSGAQMLNVVTGEPMWLEMPTFEISGGGPRCTVGIPKNMMHKFVLLKGWGFYRCRFAWRDADGNVSEVLQHYEHWNV